MAHTASTPWGAWAGETDFITSAGTDTSRTPAGMGGRAASSVQTTVRRSPPWRRASSRSFGLSQRNSPHFRR